MQKRQTTHPKLRKIFFLGSIFTFLFFEIFLPSGFAENVIPVTREVSDENGQLEFVQNEVSVKDINIDPLDTKKIRKEVVPDTKKESQKVIRLFLKTMAAVALSTCLLYIILSFIKKFYGSAFATKISDEYENLDLSTPQNKEDALKSFLDRAK